MELSEPLGYLRLPAGLAAASAASPDATNDGGPRPTAPCRGAWHIPIRSSLRARLAKEIRMATSAADIAVDAGPELGFFARYLTLWVGLCIVVGILLGQLFSGLFTLLGSAEVTRVNLPVAVLVWLIIVPMLLRIDLAALRAVAGQWRGIGVTLFVNWAVKPFSMALLGWLFIGWLFRPLLPPTRSIRTSQA
jgi:hypothetical protein